MPQGELDGSNISGWTPTLREECLPAGVIPEEVEGFVDGLFLDNNILPARQAFANLQQFCVSARTRVVQRNLYILNAAGYFTKRLKSMLCIRVDGVERGAHTLGDLADFGQEGVSVSKDDENVLPGLRSRHRIDERLDDISMVHIQVPAQYTP